MKPIILVALPLALAACTTAEPYEMAERDREQLNEELAGLVPGEPQDCLDINSMNRTTYIDEKTVIYRRGSTRYLQTFDNVCPGLGSFGNALVLEPFGGRVCKHDTARIIDNNSGLTGGICGFGEFIPYEKPADS